MDSEPAEADAQSDVEDESREAEKQETDEEDVEDEEEAHDMYVWLKQTKAFFMWGKPILFLFFLPFVSDQDTSWTKASTKKVTFILPEEEDSEEDSEREDTRDILGGKSQSTISKAQSSFEKRQEKVNSKDYYRNFRFRL